MEDKYLIVGDRDTTFRDSLAIIDRLCCENPEMTISEYLEKRHKIIMILN